MAKELVTTRVDDDGVQVTVRRQMASADYAASIVTRETVAGGIWTRITTEPINDIKVWLITETRPVPGNPVPAAQITSDNTVETKSTVLKKASTITPSATESGGIITKVDQQAVSDLVSNEVTSSTPIVPHKLSTTEIPILIPERFRPITPLHTKGITLAGVITDPPVLGAGEFSRKEEQVDALEFRRTTEAIDTTVLPISLTDYKMTGAKQIETILVTLDVGLQTLSGDIDELTIEASVDTLSKDSLGNVLLSLKTVGTVPSLFGGQSASTSIRDAIPERFRAILPIYTFDNTSAGTITVPPVLDAGELSRKEEQLDQFTFRRSIETLASTPLPVTLLKAILTTKFGGTVLSEIATLDSSPMAVDQGLMVVSSESSQLTPAGSPNPLYLKITQMSVVDVAWPPLPSRLWDENMRLEYDEVQQVVASGSAEDADPGGAVFAWSSEVKAIDKWRSHKVNVSKPSPIYVDFASALVSYDYKPFKFPGLIYRVVAGASGYYVRRASAQLCRHVIRTWWEKSGTTPVITVDEIILDQIIISELNNVTRLAYADDVLHDDITTFGIFFYPATTPSYTAYVGSWLGNEKIVAASVTPEREKDIWKCQTRSVIMR